MEQLLGGLAGLVLAVILVGGFFFVVDRIDAYKAKKIRKQMMVDWEEDIKRIKERWTLP